MQPSQRREAREYCPIISSSIVLFGFRATGVYLLGSNSERDHEDMGSLWCCIQVKASQAHAHSEPHILGDESLIDFQTRQKGRKVHTRDRGLTTCFSLTQSILEDGEVPNLSLLSRRLYPEKRFQAKFGLLEMGCDSWLPVPILGTIAI